MKRLHLALMMLGKWQGRAVAFVVGCGLGVLLRMFFVLTVILYRSVRCGSQAEELAQYGIVLREDPEDIAVPPPHFIVDEKVALLEDKA